MLTVTNASGFGSGRAAPFLVTYITTAAAEEWHNPHTFSSVGLGSDTGTKHIILGVAWDNDGRAMSTITVAGQSATQLVTAVSSGPSGWSAIWIVQLTGVTSGDIVLTQSSGAATGHYVSVFQMLNGSITPTDTFYNSDDPMTGTLDIAANGACIGAAHANTSATFEWTGITEVYDKGSNGAKSMALGTAMSLETGRTITANPSGSPTQRALSVASFEAA